MIYAAEQLIVGDGKTLIPNGALRVDDNGIITYVGTLDELVSLFPQEEMVRYEDCTMLPGLIDMHVHLGYYYSQPDVSDFDDYMVAFHGAEQARRALKKGITTVRDMSSPKNLCIQIRRAAEKGYILSPRIYQSDTGICMTGGHGHDDGIIEVDGPWAIRKAIREQIRDGVEWIKILTTNRGDIPEFTQEELEAAVDECHRVGMKCAIHAGTNPGMQMSIDAGFDTIEHGTFLTLDQVEQMKDNGQAWVPTMTAYTVLYEFTKEKLAKGVEPGDRIGAKAIRDMAFFEPAYKHYRDNFKLFYDTGVMVLAGTDMVLREAPAFPIDRELQLMVEYGITPLQAIQTATANPAKVLDAEEQFGQLKPGLMADLLIVEGNAAENIKALSNVKAVYQKGIQSI